RRWAGGLVGARAEPGAAPVSCSGACGLDGPPAEPPSLLSATRPAAVRWPPTVRTSGTLGTAGPAFVVDRIRIPDDNPWRRNVRFADIAFPAPDRAALVTFAGDVWPATGLDAGLERITWRRFAPGPHEPLPIVA